MSKLKYVLIALLGALLVAQFIPVERTNPPIDAGRTLQAHAQLNPQVSAVLDRSCADCHSHRTVWPWWSRVAPASWLVSSDVSDGRRELNLSDWQRYDVNNAARKLEKICEEVQGGDMPLWFYTPLHPGTRVSATDRQAVCAWTKAELARLK